MFGIEHLHGSLLIHCEPLGHVGPAPKHARGREHTLPPDHPSNRLLAALTHSKRPLWTELLESVELPARLELHAQDAAATHIHFPVSALVMLIHVSTDGSETPVALVGNDGVVGVAAFMGSGAETNRAVVLHPGLAWRLPTSAVPTDGPGAASLIKAVVGHLLSLTSQISQTAFCQQRHNVEQRLARWLLTALDRLPGHEMTIDLGELAAVLGVSAEAMAGAAAQLVDVGALVCEPQRLVIPSRVELLARSCGCHAPAQGVLNVNPLQPV
jgi:CRP-like cAMP-binding protein